MNIFCIILGVVTGFTISFSFIISRITKTNDFGNASATFTDFSQEEITILKRG